MKNGMKQTEIGEIPVEWEVVTLGNSCNLSMSNVDKKSKEGELEVALCNYMDVYNNHYITGNIPFMQATATQAQIDRFSLRKGDVIITKDSETKEDIAQAAAVIEDLENVLCGYHLALIRPHKSKFNGVFLANLFGLDSIRKQLTNKANGTTRFGLNVGTIDEVKLPLPPLPEQRKIADILSTLDEKMAVMDEQLAQTQELKKGLMQRLLTKGIGHTQFKESPLGEIPASWEVSAIDKHVSFFSGFPFKSEQFNQEGRGTRVLRGINVTVGALRWNESIDRYWDEPFDEFEKYSLKEGDLVISMDGSLVGRNFARVSKEYLPLLLVQRVACIRTKGTLNIEYLRQIVGGPLFINYVDAVKTSSGIPHISGKQIRDFKILVPPLLEQERISVILSTLDEKIGVLQDKKAQYQTLKRGLMQQLLTGQRRVRVPALETAALL